MSNMTQGINPLFEKYCLEILSTSSLMEGFHKIAQVVLYSAMWNSGRFERIGPNGITLEYRLRDPETGNNKHADAVGVSKDLMYIYEVKPAWHLRVKQIPERTDVHSKAIDQLKGYVKLACGQRNGRSGTFKADRGFHLGIPNVVIYDDSTVQVSMAFTQENGLVGYKIGFAQKSGKKKSVSKEVSIEKAADIMMPIISNYRLGIETDAHIQMTKALGAGVTAVYTVSAITAVGGLAILPVLGEVPVMASYSIASDSLAIYASQLAMDASIATTDVTTVLIGVLEDGSCVQILAEFLNSLPVGVG